MQAFAATRTGRRLLDNPGRLGAETVLASRPISGARRASVRAQSAVEESASQLEKARDRWGALMRGLAGDLDIPPEDLVQMVEAAALDLALQDAALALTAAVEAMRYQHHPDPAVAARIAAARAALGSGD